MAENEKQSDIASLTVELLSAYLANNAVPSADLAGLIQSTRAALTQDGAPAAPEAEQPTFTPAVTARKSLASPEHIVSMIDGKPYKTLKRHLSANALTPESYRERYNLPASYPMVAPAFAAKRREIAERIGLGNKRAAAVAPAAEVEIMPATDPVAALTGADQAVPPAAKSAKAKRAPVAAAKPRKTSTRKPKDAAKAATEVSVQSAPVASEEGSGDNVDGAAVADQAKTAPASRRKAGEPAGKPKTGGAMPKAAATRQATVKLAIAETVAAEAAPETASETSAPAKTSKRGGKLGLFGKGAGTSEVDGASTAEEPQASDAPADAPIKPARAKRMARAPKAEVADAAKTTE
jgi:predicted transcriptional regulator